MPNIWLQPISLYEPDSYAIWPCARAACRVIGPRSVAVGAFGLTCFRDILRAGVDETFLWGGHWPPSPGAEAGVGGQSPPYDGSRGAVQSRIAAVNWGHTARISRTTWP
jgi:hypothetical protein